MSTVSRWQARASRSPHTYIVALIIPALAGVNLTVPAFGAAFVVNPVFERAEGLHAIRVAPAARITNIRHIRDDGEGEGELDHSGGPAIREPPEGKELPGVAALMG